MTSVRTVRTPIGDECYEQSSGNEELLPVHASEGQSTVKASHSLVGSLLWGHVALVPTSQSMFRKQRNNHISPFYAIGIPQKVLSVVRYLKGSKLLKVHIVKKSNPGAPLDLTTLSDADASVKADRKSLTGAVVELSGMLVS
uniref:AlNc14C101G6029 protein n=1 Tax=Albugo laibachii Nc14 TaxID=890382 RepID=F0WHG6_9STRA|nr:AlNc14C101G6029 [Albugo laibachii Nc14]|eukprot:CCA20685.1 AlNc14C101G6029 [Albugo laibachii Nc14]